jgi:hypothetical protein
MHCKPIASSPQEAESKHAFFHVIHVEEELLFARRLARVVTTRLLFSAIPLT